MSTPESKLWNWFNDKVGKQLDYCKRVETKREDGFPDIVIVHKRIVQPMELKQAINTKRPKTIPMRKDQVLWWNDWTYNGGLNGHILFQYDINKCAIINGSHAQACSECDYFWEQHSFLFNSSHPDALMDYIKKFTKSICTK